VEGFDHCAFYADCGPLRGQPFFRLVRVGGGWAQCPRRRQVPACEQVLQQRPSLTVREGHRHLVPELEDIGEDQVGLNYVKNHKQCERKYCASL